MKISSSLSCKTFEMKIVFLDVLQHCKSLFEMQIFFNSIQVELRKKI